MFRCMASWPRDRLFKIPTLTSGFHLPFFSTFSTRESHLGNPILPVPPAEPTGSILFRAALVKRLWKETEADSRKLPSGFRVADAHMSLEKIQQGRRWKILWAGWWRLKCKEDFFPLRIPAVEPSHHNWSQKETAGGRFHNIEILK